MEDKTIDPDFLVPGYAYFFKEILFITQCAYGGHEPAITISPLANVIGAHAVDVELRLLEDILGRKVSRSLGRYSSMGAQEAISHIPQPVSRTEV